jgi:multidrug efflux pump
VVALTIPLVLAATFFAMRFFGIDLHRISLGALIIALGLLVDDAMIAVEMMDRKLEEGYDKLRAATFAYTSTAFPMLTGTLITVAGFMPIGLSQAVASSPARSSGALIALAWVVAVTPRPIWDVLLREALAVPIPTTPISRASALVTGASASLKTIA